MGAPPLPPWLPSRAGVGDTSRQSRSGSGRSESDARFAASAVEAEKGSRPPSPPEPVPESSTRELMALGY